MIISKKNICIISIIIIIFLIISYLFNKEYYIDPNSTNKIDIFIKTANIVFVDNPDVFNYDLDAYTSFSKLYNIFKRNNNFYSYYAFMNQIFSIIKKYKQYDPSLATQILPNVTPLFTVNKYYFSIRDIRSTRALQRCYTAMYNLIKDFLNFMNSFKSNYNSEYSNLSSTIINQINELSLLQTPLLNYINNIIKLPNSELGINV